MGRREHAQRYETGHCSPTSPRPHPPSLPVPRCSRLGVQSHLLLAWPLFISPFAHTARERRAALSDGSPLGRRHRYIHHHSPASGRLPAAAIATDDDSEASSAASVPLVIHRGSAGARSKTHGGKVGAGDEAVPQRRVEDTDNGWIETLVGKVREALRVSPLRFIAHLYSPNRLHVVPWS